MKKPTYCFSCKNFLTLIIILAVAQLAFLLYAQNQITSLQGSVIQNQELLSDNAQILTRETSTIESDLDKIKKELNILDESLSETQMDLEEEISRLKTSSSQDFSNIIEDSIESIVSIQTQLAQGTGFIITSDGYIVTNAHVIEGAIFANAIPINNNPIPMKLIGKSEELDLALLKINGTYKALELANSDRVDVGEKVIAIGNPFGLEFSVSEGIVSATSRKTPNFQGEYIQTDAALNSGNSGGPLIDTSGKVVGVNNFKILGDNIGFALKSNFVIEEINNIALEELGTKII